MKEMQRLSRITLVSCLLSLTAQGLYLELPSSFQQEPQIYEHLPGAFCLGHATSPFDDYMPDGYNVTGPAPLKIPTDYTGCGTLKNTTMTGSIVVVLRGGEDGCSFYDKVAAAKQSGALGVVVANSNEDYWNGDDLVIMYSEQGNVKLPCMFVGHDAYISIQKFTANMTSDEHITATMDGRGDALPPDFGLGSLMWIWLPICAILVAYFGYRGCVACLPWLRATVGERTALSAYRAYRGSSYGGARDGAEVSAPAAVPAQQSTRADGYDTVPDEPEVPAAVDTSNSLNAGAGHIVPLEVQEPDS